MKKIPKDRVKAILFDAGQTLTFPASGHWYIPPNFSGFFERELGTRYAPALIKKAFKKGSAYLWANHSVQTEAHEYEQFKVFYEIFLRELGYPGISEELVSALARDNVCNDGKFCFYEDVSALLPILRSAFLLAIVSDAWPSLDRVFANAGLRRHFSAFVISSQIGVPKPAPEMLLAATDALGISPREAVFLDDRLSNLEGAHELGMHPVLIDREGSEKHAVPFPVVGELRELLRMLDL